MYIGLKHLDLQEVVNLVFFSNKITKNGRSEMDIISKMNSAKMEDLTQSMVQLGSSQSGFCNGAQIECHIDFLLLILS